MNDKISTQVYCKKLLNLNTTQSDVASLIDPGILHDILKIINNYNTSTR